MKEMLYRLRRYPDGAVTYTIRDVRFHVGVWTRAPEVLERKGQDDFPLAKFAAEIRDQAGRVVFDVAEKEEALAIEKRETDAARQVAKNALLTRVIGSSVETAELAQGAVSSPSKAEDPGAEKLSKEKVAEELEEKALAEKSSAKIKENKRKREKTVTESTAIDEASSAPAQAGAGGSRRAQRLARRGGAGR